MSEIGHEDYHLGDPVGVRGSAHAAERKSASAGAAPGGAGAGRGLAGFSGVEHVVDDTGQGRGWGSGPIPPDKRKIRFDLRRGLAADALPFSAPKADRMTATAAGNMMDRIFQLVDIKEDEEGRRLAFMRALFFEHTINGASMLQNGDGELEVDGMVFDIGPIKAMLGPHQRKFFRAYADEVADVNRYVYNSFDPRDDASAERYGHLIQVAAERGLQKFPWYAHDSSDACLRMSHDERVAVMRSKAFVLPSENRVDALPEPRTEAKVAKNVG